MKIKCLLVIPGKEVQKVRIPASMKFIKAFIGKDLYKYRLDENTLLFADKNADIDEFNRLIHDDIIIGTFLVVAVKNDKLISMKTKSLRRYTNIFKLRKHKMKVNYYKIKYLEKYYENMKKARQEEITNVSKLAA